MAAVAQPWAPRPPVQTVIELSSDDLEIEIEAAPDTDKSPAPPASQSDLPTVPNLDVYDEDASERTLPSVPIPVSVPVQPVVVVQREPGVSSHRVFALCGAWALAGVLMGVGMACVFVAAVTL